MNNQSFLEKTRQLVSDARVDEALDATEVFLKNEPRYAKLYKEAIRISAKFNKTKRDELANTISFENAKLNFGQVNASLLHLLEYIESGDFDPPELRPHRPTMTSFYRSNKWLFWAGLPTILLSIIVLVLVFREKPPQSNEQTDMAETACVLFADKAFPKIVVLPFFHPAGDELGADGLIVERLEDFSAQLDLDTDVELCSQFKPEKLLNFAEAEDLGHLNQSDLIIWGRAEKAGEEIAVKTRFKLLNTPDTLTFTNLKWQGEKTIDTVKVLSIITSRGELTSDVEATIRLVLGLVADRSGRGASALAVLENAQVTDSAGVLLKNMLLAEQYFKKGESEKAVAAYDSLLNVHPNYWLAENNRGVLQAGQQNYLEAIVDFSDVLTKRPDDVETYLARGMAYLQSDQLIPGLKDFQKVLKLKPEKQPEIGPMIKETENEVERLEKQLEEANKLEGQKKLNQRQAKEATNASIRLGNQKQAKVLVGKSIKLSPNDPENIANVILLKLRENDLTGARQTFKSATGKGVERTKILAPHQEVRRFVEREKL